MAQFTTKIIVIKGAEQYSVQIALTAGKTFI